MAVRFRVVLVAALCALSLCAGLACQRIVAPAPAPAAATGAPLRVMTSGGFAAAYNVLAPRFQRERGVQIKTAYGSSSGGAPDSIPVRLARGEPVDVIILSRSSLDRLTAEGEVHPETRVDLVRSQIGMAVRAGAPRPDISTREAFVATLLAAESIGYSASASGRYLSQTLFPRLEIWNRIEGKSRRILSERVASVVARGEVQIGFQQISEILPIEGADYAGPIPEELQKTTTFSAGITKRAQSRRGAEELLAYLSSRAVAETIRATGLAPVVLERDARPAP